MISQLQEAINHLEQAAGLISPFEMGDLIGAGTIDRAGASIARAVTLIKEELKAVESNKLRRWMAGCKGVEIIQESRSTILKFKSAQDAQDFIEANLVTGNKNKNLWKINSITDTIDLSIPDWEAITLGLRNAFTARENVSSEARK